MSILFYYTCLFLISLSAYIIYRTRGSVSSSWNRKHVVLITGSASGLGRQLAKDFDALGSRLILWDCDETKLKTLASKLHHDHVWQVVDVSKEAQILEAIDSLKASNPEILQQLSHFVMCAGIVNGKEVMQLKTENVNQSIDTNFMQSYYITKYFQSYISMNQGVMTYISSVVGLIPLSKLSDYCASKFALTGFVESLRLEMRQKKDGAKTCLVLPFIINTKMFKGVRIQFPANLFLSVLNKKNVSERIIQGLVKGEEWIVLPWILRFVPLMLILPTKLRNILYDFISEHRYMDHFEGQK